ncbi:uncharacterized protein EI97DRAFT_440306 [Westerdykella ornata]|uniref:Uncharacterized protein n=1 Tax=Westerdykella ornata TaxID=318751 RepID=A0A6A6JUS3_WESOR|nr:uncharacterized protein EI97DRAFT_440306 [Westerdykella ornata]KAF2278789.1 hypothetical protein EI97DRAFT_440306 [Westerdykella ornata]
MPEEDAYITFYHTRDWLRAAARQQNAATSAEIHHEWSTTPTSPQRIAPNATPQVSPVNNKTEHLTVRFAEASLPDGPSQAYTDCTERGPGRQTGYATTASTEEYSATIAGSEYDNVHLLNSAETWATEERQEPNGIENWSHRTRPESDSAGPQR